MSARPSDVSLGERSRRFLILGSTRDDWDGTTLPCVSIMVCPLKELDTSALSASPRTLTEGVLEVEGPTLADAGVASCLLFDTETVFRRLRDDLLAGKLFEGMMRRGWKHDTKAIGGKSSRKLRNFRGAGKTVRSIGQLQRRGWGGSDRHEDENENFQTQKTFSSNHLTYRP